MKKLIIAFILGGVVFGSITGVVAYNYNAKDVSYTPTDSGWNVNNVSDAIKDLKDIKTNRENGVEVATLTTQGATYTMQNDGYIIGTAGNGTNRDAAILYLDESPLVLAQWDDDNILRNVSVYAKKGTVVKIRENGSTYNLTVYEWK